MRGTEKQIKFGRDILKKFIENAERFINFVEPVIKGLKEGKKVDDEIAYEFNKLVTPIIYKNGWKDGDSEEKAIEILETYISNLKKYIEDMKNEKNDFSDASFIIRHGKDHLKYIANDILYLFPVVQTQEFYGI